MRHVISHVRLSAFVRLVQEIIMRPVESEINYADAKPTMIVHLFGRRYVNVLRCGISALCFSNIWTADARWFTQDR